MFLGLVDVAALLLLKKTTTPKAEEEVEEFEAFPVRTEGAMALIVAIYRANEVLGLTDKTLFSMLLLRTKSMPKNMKFLMLDISS